MALKLTLSLYSAICFAAAIVYFMYGLPAYFSPEKFVSLGRDPEIVKGTDSTDTRWFGFMTIVLAVYYVVCAFAKSDGVKKGVIYAGFLGGTFNIVGHLKFLSAYSKNGIICTVAFWPFMLWYLYKNRGGCCCDTGKKTTGLCWYKYVLSAEVFLYFACGILFGFFHENVWMSSGNEEILPWSSFEFADGSSKKMWEWCGIMMMNMSFILSAMVCSKDVAVQKLVLGAIAVCQAVQAYQFIVVNQWLPSAGGPVILAALFIVTNAAVIIKGSGSEECCCSKSEGCCGDKKKD